MLAAAAMLLLAAMQNPMAGAEIPNKNAGNANGSNAAMLRNAALAAAPE